MLIPGWRELRSAPLEEICARQYIACNEEVLEARDAVEPSRWHEIAYDELMAAPVETTRSLFERLGLAFSRSVEEYARALPGRPGSTTVSRPRPNKWQDAEPGGGRAGVAALGTRRTAARLLTAPTARSSTRAIRAAWRATSCSLATTLPSQSLRRLACPKGSISDGWQSTSVRKDGFELNAGSLGQADDDSVVLLLA